MFLLLFALTTLCGIVNEKAENIKICAIPVSVAQNPPNFLMRPSVPVENCQDRDAAAFSLINTTLSPPAATCRDERLNCAAIRTAHSCSDMFRTTIMQQCTRTCGYCT
ncbi:unnamed protein product [Dracunculus medinensis]|uniref:ShKT domain-containing protein n=1 Tax=Dracunculus medinensis TaxID=318479 RepID=A0A0N4UR22_DRAME|nr:unnamed protein product [Dracunculus medinensis]